MTMLEQNIESEGYPRYVPPYLAWDERIKRSAGYVCSAFTFDVAVPASCTDIGIGLRPFLLRASLRSMPCAVVESVPSYLSNYVYPGDILLKVNDEVLVSYEQPISLTRVLSLLSTQSMRSIRFLRPAGMAAQPSPGEAVVLATGSNVTAKFELNKGVAGSAEPWTMVLKAIDVKAPPVVRRILAGNKINWEPYVKPPLPSVTVGKPDESRSLGVYKDRNRWVAVSRPKRPLEEDDDLASSGLSDKRCFFLGRFDTEVEAQRACLRAQDEIRAGRLFLSSKGGRIVPSFGTALPPSISGSQVPNSLPATTPGSSTAQTVPTVSGAQAASSSETPVGMAPMTKSAAADPSAAVSSKGNTAP